MIHAFSFEGTNGVPSPFSIGLPLPKGTFWPEQKLQLVTESGARVISSVTPTSLWDDKSIRWCHIDGYCEHEQRQSFFLSEGQATLFKKQDCAFEKDGAFILKSKDLTLQVASDSFLSLKQLSTAASLPLEKSLLEIAPILSLKDSATSVKLISSTLFTKTSSCNYPIYATLKQQYKVQLDAQKKYLNLIVEYKLDYPSNTLKINLSAHNPMPIIQQDGQWDLGNENSIHLSSFGLRLVLPKGAFSVANTSEKNSEFKSFEQWSLRVNNSGGENWLSKNHVDKNGTVAHKERGAVITETNNEQTNAYTELRPSLAFKLSDQEQSFAINIDHLWQKFPLEVSADRDQVHINFCESNADCAIELQPGEIKFHSFSIALEQAAPKITTDMQPSTITPNPELFCRANTIPWLSKSIAKGPLSEIVNLGLTGKNNFFAKREAVDEFGWRNFGDLYADHEAVGHKGEDIFVSHYNNQYDPLQGFLKQWLLSGDAKWKELADDLFEHIVNIDIYHTELDKMEYNGGLFWHTDHYVEAETATHRTYSKRQQKNVYEDHAGGGGPGSHHCYTSGLALYYQLTGNESAKSAVLKLSNWITYFFEGDGTLLGTLLQYRNKAIVRNPLTGRYPLDRGVANYVNALLDSYELTANATYMQRVSTIITQTFHFNDVIAERNFEDIENTWYYIVFMQSVAKYLWVCETVYGIDNDYATIKKSFLHYVEWIATKEQAYLENHEKLEYPNDTWTAQDLRKIMVLSIALHYADTEPLKESIKLKIASLKQFVEEKLGSSKEKEFTRIIALIMQNNIGEISHSDLTNSGDPEVSNEHSSPAFSILGFAWRFIKNYSLTREFKHLFIRFPQLRFK